MQHHSKLLPAALVLSYLVAHLSAQSGGCYYGDIYLGNYTYLYIDGDYFHGGRVEVCYNGTYRPVCDEGWTDSDAAVVCNHFGYGYSYYRSEATGGMVFGLSDETPILQNLMCNGSEYSLSDCPGYNLNGVSGEYCLSGDYQAGVRCIEVPIPCYDGDIRLENSTYPYTADGSYFYGGRVEVCYNDTYRPVCDEGWNESDAAVICNYVGYSYSYYRSEATGGMVFGLSDEAPILQNLMCNGSEYSLSECPGYDLNGVSGEYCLSGNYQAGVRCIEVPTPTTPCYNGNIRLDNSTYSYIDGYYFYGGRVEVCYNGTYHPVCDEGWTDSDAAIVCNYYGYSHSYYRSEATGGMVFGLSDEIPMLQNLMCSGNEYSLSDCPGYDLNGVTGTYCLSGDYQAGVRCLEVVTSCSFDGYFELSNSIYMEGRSPGASFAFSVEGRIDYCYNQTLHGVCDVGWTDEDAAVACRYSYGEGLLSEAISGVPYGPRVPVIDNVMCDGSEYGLDQCQLSEPGQVSQECTESSTRAAGVRCYKVCYSGDVRLVGGENYAVGRVEACNNNNTWGTVCDVGWSNVDAEAACKSAGFYWGGEAIPNTGFGVSSGPILAYNVSCSGYEYSLDGCYNSTKIPSICNHARDAAARCQPGFINMNIAVNRSTEIVERNNVTLWCNAQSSSVANLTSYSWRNPQGVIVSDGGRVNITLHNGSYSNYYGEFIFNSSLTFSPVLASDRGDYVCELTIALPQVGVDISNTTSTNLHVTAIQQFSAALTFTQDSSIEDLAEQLLGQTIGDMGVTIYSVTVVDDANVLITVATAGDFPPGGVGSALSDQITATARDAGIEVTVEVTRFDGCSMEQGLSYLPNVPEYRITWPEIDIGQTASESCPCGSLDTVSYQATRTCGGDYTNGAAWRPQDVSVCVFSDTTLQLCQLTELPVGEQASNVQEIVSDSTDIDAETFTVAADIVADLLRDVDTTNAPVIDDVLNSVDSLLDVESEAAKEGLAQSRSGNMLFNAIEDFAGSVDIPTGQSTHTFSRDNFAISAEEPDSSNFEGLVFSTDSRDNFENGRISTAPGNIVPEDSIASIIIPSSFVDGTSNEVARFVFSVFADDTLFQPRSDIVEFRDLEVGSVFLSATPYGATANNNLQGFIVSDLTEPVTIQFEKAVPNVPSVCVSWDLNLDGGYGGFSTEGCVTNDQTEIVTCSCNHLTTFTILSNTSTTRSSETEDYDVPTIVVFSLLGISAVVLLITIALHLCIGVLRATKESKILIHLSVALIALYIVTVLAYVKELPEVACKVVAVLMIYFFNVALFWGLLHALLLILKLKMATFGSGFLTRNYVWIALPFAWGLPLIPALASLAGLDYFGEDGLCQVYNWPFYAFLAGSLAVFYIFDWLFYIATLVMMKCKTEGEKDTHRSTFNHVFKAMLLSLLFGIGWAFGFISSTDVSRDAHLITQYSFSILILTHAILQMILYLLHTHTSHEQPCLNTTMNEPRSSKISPDAGGIGLEARSEKTPLDNMYTSPTTMPDSHTATQSPAGVTAAHANLHTENRDAVTSYTVTNKEAMEPLDEHDNPISTF